MGDQGRHRMALETKKLGEGEVQAGSEAILFFFSFCCCFCYFIQFRSVILQSGNFRVLCTFGLVLFNYRTVVLPFNLKQNKFGEIENSPYSPL